MRERRQLCAHVGDARGVDVADDDAPAFGAHGATTSPHGSTSIEVPVRAAPARMHAALRGGQHVALVLDRARAQQRFPVRARRSAR